MSQEIRAAAQSPSPWSDYLHIHADRCMGSYALSSEMKILDLLPSGPDNFKFPDGLVREFEQSFP